jgi:hypothetical protein
MLHSARQEVPDVPAVYFVMPTRENINRICQVCEADHLPFLFLLLCFVMSFWRLSLSSLLTT